MSAIARVERIGWNTVDRWLEKASNCSRRFNDQELTGFRAAELQGDEIRTIIQGTAGLDLRKNPIPLLTKALTEDTELIQISGTA